MEACDVPNSFQTRASAVNIQKRMEQEGHKVACLTGQFEGADRDVLIDAFRDGRAKVLIATNVLARGIDVQTVSLVINYVSHWLRCWIDIPWSGLAYGFSGTPSRIRHRLSDYLIQELC